MSQLECLNCHGTEFKTEEGNIGSKWGWGWKSHKVTLRICTECKFIMLFERESRYGKSWRMSSHQNKKTKK